MSQDYSYYYDDDLTLNYPYEDTSSYTKQNIFKTGLKKLGVITEPERLGAPLDLGQYRGGMYSTLVPYMNEYEKKGVWHKGYTLFYGGDIQNLPQPIYERITNT